MRGHCFGIRAGGRAALAVVLTLAPAAGRAAERSFWAEAARVDELGAARLRAEAGVLVSGEIGEISERAAAAALANSGDRPARLAQAESQLRGAVKLAPGNAALWLDLATLQSMRGNPDAEAATLEHALRLVPPADQPAIWLRLGEARVRTRRYGDAASEYALAITAGAGTAASYVRLGELLMADGRLGEAETRYRDAIAVLTGRSTGYADRLTRTQDLARAYFGLAVALDRDDRPIAAREAVRRALDQDPTSAVLASAIVPAGEPPVIVPDGEVFYYLGLAAEADGRASYAESSFREYLARSPGGRWARAAARHLGERPAEPARGRGKKPARIAAFGTVYASGGLAAPLVDVVWRAHPALLDDCLAAARVGAGARLAIELEIDGRGEVTRATVKVPPPLDEAFARCAETAVKRQLSSGPPPRGSRRIARTEILLAPGP